MHFSSVAALLLAPSLTSAISIPRATSDTGLSTREPNSDDSFAQRLEKRRGGGGGRGGSSGGRGGSGSGSSSSGGRGSTSAAPSYSGGRTYAGGSSSSYAAGSRSPSGVSPFLLAPVGLGFGAGALFAYGAYSYPYTHPYYYVDPNTHHNDSLKVDCFCDPYSPCGCDDTGDQAGITQMLQDKNVANITDVNGTRTVVIDGTLPNGTDTSAAMSLGQNVMHQGGYWVMASIVAAMVWGS